MGFLGLAIVTWSLIALIVGILALMKGSIGQTMKGLLSMIPIGSPKLWAVVLIVFGLASGGLTLGIGYVQGAFVSGETASIASSDASASSQSLQLQDCQVLTIGASTIADSAAANITYRADPNDLTHYYVDIKNSTVSGGASINGTITCLRNTPDLRQGQYTNCYIKSDAFKSQTSTTDANTYYMIATSASKSKVSGMPWAQTAYLNDGAVATTTSNTEKTTYTFAQDTASRTLGFYFTLPGTTTVNYLNNQNSVNVRIFCGDTQTAYLTVTKVSA